MTAARVAIGRHVGAALYAIRAIGAVRDGKRKSHGDIDVAASRSELVRVARR
ncbi:MULTISPECIES: hypothetical protein [Burkholderia]|uniref:Uncharacterized protein n=1 Tax=Burkholderia anthina TaxID=179879 RepID=A0ABS2BAB2_9BURK|nr:MULTISPECIES: hypothetical protein [Burkholderia]MBM2769855.1 hypothetical protein [Burkholderia anthina]